jgi:plastocyanin
MHPTRRLFALTFAGLMLAFGAQAAEPEIPLVIKDHKFEPAEVKIKAGEKVRLIVHNQDSTPEEFESHSLKREKVIPGGQKATILIGPLKAGRYEFYGEFHEKTAQGVVVAE